MSQLNWVTEKVKKHKKLTIALVVVLVLAVAGTALAGNVNKKKEEMLAMMNQSQTSKVERRTLVSSVSATGYLTSVDSKEIKVALSGVDVTEVNVEIGDMVEEGQVLCTFDSADIEEALSEAKTHLNVTTQKTQMDLATAERNLADAKENYDTSMKRANTDLGVAYNNYVESLEDVEEAKGNWDEAKAATIEKKGELELRENQLKDAQAALSSTGSSAVHKQSFETKKEELGQKIEVINTDADASNDVSIDIDLINIDEDLSVIGATNNPEIDGLMEGLKALQSTYRTSQQAEVKVSSLQQEVAAWQTKYNTAKSGEDSYEKAYEQAKSASEAQLSAYDKQKRNVEDTEKNVENAVITRTDNLTTAQLNALSSGNNEEDQIEQYQQQLDDCTVEAPISGVISAINIAAGDTYNGTGIVTIDDVSSFEVATEIDEYDIAQIKKGQKVVIKTNATGDEELEGTVKIVSPKATATTTGNNVTYKVIISVDTPNEVLRMDMTAKLSIILDSKENVLTVPYEAVQEGENGKFYVEVVDASNEDSAGDAVEKANVNKGKINKANMPKASSAGASDIATKRIFVEKGMESDYYIEIISADITEGMEVVVPKSNDDFNSIQNMMRMQGPMGGF